MSVFSAALKTYNCRSVIFKSRYKFQSYVIFRKVTFYAEKSHQKKVVLVIYKGEISQNELFIQYIPIYIGELRRCDGSSDTNC